MRNHAEHTQEEDIAKRANMQLRRSTLLKKSDTKSHSSSMSMRSVPVGSNFDIQAAEAKVHEKARGHAAARFFKEDKLKKQAVLDSGKSRRNALPGGGPAQDLAQKFQNDHMKSARSGRRWQEGDWPGNVAGIIGAESTPGPANVNVLPAAADKSPGALDIISSATEGIGDFFTAYVGQRDFLRAQKSNVNRYPAERDIAERSKRIAKGEMVKGAGSLTKNIIALAGGATEVLGGVHSGALAIRDVRRGLKAHDRINALKKVGTKDNVDLNVVWAYALEKNKRRRRRAATSSVGSGTMALSPAAGPFMPIVAAIGAAIAGTVTGEKVYRAIRKMLKGKKGKERREMAEGLWDAGNKKNQQAMEIITALVGDATRAANLVEDPDGWKLLFEKMRS